MKKKRLNVAIQQSNTKMINFDDVTTENIEEHNLNWLQILDHPYRILINAVSGSGKTNSLFNLICYQPDNNKTYMLKICMKHNINC